MIKAFLKSLVGHNYQIYNDANLIKKYNDILIKLMGPCKNTVKDTLQLEDYDMEGFIPIGAIKESFVTLDIELD
jgi:hypothetical protein